MSSDLILNISVIAFAALVFGLLLTGLCLVIRDTRRRKGNWGINTEPASCRECRTPAPAVRVPASFRQALWGGWTCQHCGLELDKWGEPVDDQPRPARRAAPIDDSPAPRPPSTRSSSVKPPPSPRDDIQKG